MTAIDALGGMIAAEVQAREGTRNSLTLSGACPLLLVGGVGEIIPSGPVEVATYTPGTGTLGEWSTLNVGDTQVFNNFDGAPHNGPFLVRAVAGSVSVSVKG